MADAEVKLDVTVRVSMTLPEVGLLCDALKNPPCEDEGAEYKERREHIYSVLEKALKVAYQYN